MVGDRLLRDLRRQRDVVIPESVMEIGEWWFQYSEVESVTILRSVKNIGLCAFYDCDNFKRVCVEDGCALDVRKCVHWSKKVLHACRVVFKMRQSSLPCGFIVSKLPSTRELGVPRPHANREAFDGVLATFQILVSWKFVQGASFECETTWISKTRCFARNCLSDEY